MLILTALGFALLALASLAGCGRTVLVSEGSPMRTGEAIRGRVYTLIDGKWVLSGNTVEIPEGWYIVPPSFVEENGGPR